jgi:hypothetical protein
MKAITFLDGFKGYLAVFDSKRGLVEFVNTSAHSGKAMSTDKMATCRQMFERGKTNGRPLEWALEKRHMGRDFARAFGARHIRFAMGMRVPVEE